MLGVFLYIFEENMQNCFRIQWLFDGMVCIFNSNFFYSVLLVLLFYFKKCVVGGGDRGSFVFGYVV